MRTLTTTAAAALVFAGPALAEEPAATVAMTDAMRYDPPSITINAGETVLWRNTSGLVHTVTAEPEAARDPSHVQLPEGAEPFGSGMIQSGDTFTHTFTVPGEYTYFCVPHEMLGMVGTVTVQ